MPVFKAFLLARLQSGRRISVLVEMFRESAFGTCEGDEINSFACLRIDVPVFFHVWISGETEAFLELRTFPRIVNEDREGSRIRRQLCLVFRHVVADSVLGLAGGEHVDNRGAGILVGVHYGFIEMIGMGASRLR